MSPAQAYRPLPRTPALLIALALTAGAFADRAAAATAELPSAKDSWIELRTEHFAIFSAAPERTATRLATRLERLRQVLGRLGGEDGLALTRPTDILIFRDERAFRAFRPLGPDGKPRTLGGYFLARSDRNSIALYDWSRAQGGDPVEPILHEYMHSLLDVSFTRLPVWANEGIADFYTTFQVSERQADIGRPVHDYVRVLEGMTKMPTARLLAVTQDDPEYNESSRQTIFYAQAWLTTHYLLLGRPGRGGDFARYFELLAGGTEPAKAFVDAFAITPEALDDALIVYQRKRAYPFMNYEFSELPPLGELSVRPLGYAEVLARLGDLARRLGPAERPRGVELLEAARRTDPASPLPLLGLGHARLDEGRPAEAEALFRETLDVAPGFEPAQSALGILLAYRAPGRASDASRAAEARDLLRRATAQEPGRLDAWLALGNAELAEGGDSKRAIAAFETAWKLAPERSDIVGGFALALADDGQFPRAAAIVRKVLLGSPRAGDRLTGQHYLKQIADREIATLANSGDLALALARIAAYPEAATDPELAKSLNAYKAQIESNLAGQRCSDTFNEGIRLANAQQFAPARVVFEKVVAECAATDLALVERAREVMEEIRKFEKPKR